MKRLAIPFNIKILLIINLIALFVPLQSLYKLSIYLWEYRKLTYSVILALSYNLGFIILSTLFSLKTFNNKYLSGYKWGNVLAIFIIIARIIFLIRYKNFNYLLNLLPALYFLYPIGLLIFLPLGYKKLITINNQAPLRKNNTISNLIFFIKLDSSNKKILCIIVIILIATTWFGLGYLLGYLYFYPLILLVLAIVILIKEISISKKNYR